MRLKPWIWPAAASAVALAAAVLGLLVVDRLGEQAIARQQTAMAAAARDYFVAFARDEGVQGLAIALNRHAGLRSADGFRYALEGRAGRMLAGADVVSSLDAPDAGWRTVVEPDTSPRRFWRVLSQPLGGGYTLVVAEDLSARDALRQAVFRGSALAVLLTALGAMAGGVGLNAMLLRRTRDIARTAEAIAGGDLSARAPVRPRGDVFDDLGGSLNHMLARIEALMVGMRSVTDSIAHDLRSPLTRMKGALVRAGDPQATEAARQAALDEASAQADSVLATLNALLDIAHAESGLSQENMRRIDVAALVVSLAELFGPAVEDAGQTLVTEAPDYPVLARAHPDLLRQAVGNLLHNAVIHAGPGAMVTLSVADDGAGGARISVGDDGPGVPAESLGRVQERFVRLETARTTSGSGLGLALVAACAKLHGGRLVLGDNRPGLVAALEIVDPRSCFLRRTILVSSPPGRARPRPGWGSSRRPRVMMEKVPMTAEGYSALDEELKRLKTVERPAVIAAIGEARLHGDLSENAEYHAAKDRQGWIEGQIAEIEDKMARAQVIDVSKLSGAQIKFGATVSVVDEDTEEEARYQIVGEHEADVKRGRVSITSPIARAIIGKEKGDVVEVITPSGGKSYEITKVEWV